MTIRELLNKVKILPHPMYYKKGDIYSEEILNRGESAVSELTEMILDDKNISSVAYTDKHYYFIGDIAARFIHDINAEKMILHNFLWDKFKLEGTFLPNLATSNYGKLIIFKTNIDRKKNRKLLYEYIKNMIDQIHILVNSFLHQLFEDIYIFDNILWIDTEKIRWGELKERRVPLEYRGGVSRHLE